MCSRVTTKGGMAENSWCSGNVPRADFARMTWPSWIMMSVIDGANISACFTAAPMPCCLSDGSCKRLLERGDVGHGGLARG